jgi:uncharacterized membrane protein YqjE
MLDRDVKELLTGFAAILIFAVAIVYFRQQARSWVGGYATCILYCLAAAGCHFPLSAIA